jgi:hypothetical protein
VLVIMAHFWSKCVWDTYADLPLPPAAGSVANTSGYLLENHESEPCGKTIESGTDCLIITAYAENGKADSKIGYHLASCILQ